MKPLAVLAVQTQNRPGYIRESLATMNAALEDAVQLGADLVIFPECNLTGYRVNRVVDIAITPESDAIADIEHTATELGMAIGFGYIERVANGETTANTYAIISGQNRLVYRKTHLGTVERNVFCAGDELPTNLAKGVRVGVQLCWEAHIPEITSTLRAKGAELVIMPHASKLDCARRLALWNRYLPARAMDNGIFVVACNASYKNDNGSWAGGGAAAFDPKGLPVESVQVERAAESATYRTALFKLEGKLPRDQADGDMGSLSYFDRRRPELYL